MVAELVERWIGRVKDYVTKNIILSRNVFFISFLVE
jgi:hypothetical protein